MKKLFLLFIACFVFFSCSVFEYNISDLSEAIKVYTDKYGEYEKTTSTSMTTRYGNFYDKEFKWSNNDPYLYLVVKYESKNNKTWKLSSEYISLSPDKSRMTFSNGNIIETER